jgi:flagellar basal-body rod protein FlgB
MFISDVTTAGAIPALEATLKFAAARQPVIASNIANLDTPNFRPMDVSPSKFQRQLSKAIDERRARTGGQSGSLDLGRTTEVRQGADGGLTLTPTTPQSNVLFHDRNNRDLERLIQDQTENLATYRLASELLRSRFELLRSAAAERV